MHRLGGLLYRLRREATTQASNESSQSLSVEISSPSTTPLVILDQAFSASLSTDPTESLKQQRHKYRRERQRQNRKLGHNDKIEPEAVEDNQTVGGEADAADASSSNVPLYDHLTASIWFVAKKDNQLESNFLKSAKWSPDGGQISTNSEDGKLRVFHCPGAIESKEEQSKVIAPLECIYDLAWYPCIMPSQELIVTSSRNRPIQLWDVSTASLRASYRSYNHLETIESPVSLCFSTYATHLIAGYNNFLRLFPLEYPGSHSVKISLNNYSSDYHLSGIISSIATNMDQSQVIGCASFNQRKIVLFHETDLSPIMQLFPPTQEGDISQIKFSPCGHFLYAACRGNNAIFCFDLRGGRPGECLWTVDRVSSNNQRIGFDVNLHGNLLATGSQDGQVRLFDLSAPLPSLISPSPFSPYEDVVNSFQFHPYLNYWCFTTGQRVAPTLDSSSEDSDDASSSDSAVLNQTLSDSSKQQTAFSYSMATTSKNHLVVGYFG